MRGGISQTQWRATKRLLHTRGRREAGRILVEGARAVETALARTEGLRTVLAGPQLTPRSRETIGRAEKKSVPVVDLTGDQAAELASTAHAQGVFGVVTWKPRVGVPAAAGPLILYLSGLRNPANLGALLRTAAAFGVSVCCSPDCADVAHPVALRSGAASYLDLPLFTDVPWAELRRDCRAHRCVYAAAHQGTSLDALDWPDRTVLVLGGEAAGATEPLHEDVRVRIPVAVESLNVAVAGGILLWSATRPHARSA